MNMRKRSVFPHFARSSLRQFNKSDDDHLDYLKDAITKVFAIYDTSLFKKPFILCKNMISSPSHLNILSRLNFPGRYEPTGNNWRGYARWQLDVLSLVENLE